MYNRQAMGQELLQINNQKLSILKTILHYEYEYQELDIRNIKANRVPIIVCICNLDVQTKAYV